MNFFKIKAYAKINLSLNIIKKLPSKNHKIESLISFIKLYDEIHLRNLASKKHRIYFYGRFSKEIPKDNTVSKLLKILDEKKILMNKKFEIKIKKNIPQKSGMGGGSMNAAALIGFFLKKKIIKNNNKELRSIANKIGSDVILGINPKNTILLSSGKLKKFNKKLNFNVLITKPNFGCSTKKIYSGVRHYSKPQYNKSIQPILRKKNIINSDNALEKIAFKKYPKLNKLKVFLTNLKNVIFVRMTGSGSSIVAYFHSKKDLDIATKEFKKKFNDYWFVKSKTI